MGAKNVSTTGNYLHQPGDDGVSSLVEVMVTIWFDFIYIVSHKRYSFLSNIRLKHQLILWPYMNQMWRIYVC